MVSLSFIVPVYNVEKYLQKCINSILSQISNSDELILVDDGSLDNSPKICDEVAKSFENVVVIHKANGGLSSARNKGLEIAKSEYIAFVDSDDWINENSVNKLKPVIEAFKPDICFMQADKVFESGKKVPLGDCIRSKEINGKNRKEVLNYLASRPKYPGSSCTKVFSRTFLIENNLSFPSDGRISEDLGFVRDCILKASQFAATDFPYYNYRQARKGSITSLISSRRISGVIQFITESLNYAADIRGSDEIVFKCVMSFAAYEYCVLLLMCGKENSVYLENKEKIKELKFLLKFLKSLRGKILYILSCLFGIEFLLRVISTLKK